ncbi:MAG TPA: class I SAM-dependent methyltransferase, partial [Thermoanaerobaculia bacterium]
MIRALRKIARQLPYLRDLHAYVRALETERDQLRASLAHWKTWMSPGHFYSPIPNLDEVRSREAKIWPPVPRTVPGIELNAGAQVATLGELAKFYPELPFPRTRTEGGPRYWFDNSAYSYGDAIFLYSMLRHVRPKRVIEVGSGFSSAVMLDTRERFLGDDVQLTFIDPDVSTLNALLRPGDRAAVIPARVQDVPPATFDELQAGDILFIDSTHVAKTGSDVNTILFDIVPRIASGVYVHFHDIFWPFEYPADWLAERRDWTEIYLLQALLAGSSDWEVVLFSSWLWD